jgi:hypothetical protein
MGGRTVSPWRKLGAQSLETFRVLLFCTIMKLPPCHAFLTDMSTRLPACLPPHPPPSAKTPP